MSTPVPSNRATLDLLSSSTKAWIEVFRNVDAVLATLPDDERRAIAPASDEVLAQIVSDMQTAEKEIPGLGWLLGALRGAVVPS